MKISKPKIIRQCMRMKIRIYNQHPNSSLTGCPRGVDGSKIIFKNLPKRLELLLRTVAALPNDSSRGDSSCSMRMRKLPVRNSVSADDTLQVR